MTRILNSIAPSGIRYIKLGKAGTLEQYCLDKGYCYIGFGTGDPVCFELVIRASETKRDFDWEKVWNYQYKSDKSGTERSRRFRATTATNQLRLFYESDDHTLWITFVNGRLYYAFLDESLPGLMSPDFAGSFRTCKGGGWSSQTITGEYLHEDNLSGQLVQTKSFKGASCKIKEDVSDYLIRRINGNLTELQIGLENARTKIDRLLGQAIKNLGSQDFEVLIDLIFTSGWKRLTTVGGVMKTKDMVYEDGLNSRSDASYRACVQVKAKTRLSEFHSYLDQFELQAYDRYFYVFHSSEECPSEFVVPEGTEIDITVWSCNDVVYQVIRCGLIDWVLNRAL